MRNERSDRRRGELDLTDVCGLNAIVIVTQHDLPPGIRALSRLTVTHPLVSGLISCPDRAVRHHPYPFRLNFIVQRSCLILPSVFVFPRGISTDRLLPWKHSRKCSSLDADNLFSLSGGPLEWLGGQAFILSTFLTRHCLCKCQTEIRRNENIKLTILR